MKNNHRPFAYALLLSATLVVPACDSSKPAPAEAMANASAKPDLNTPIPHHEPPDLGLGNPTKEELDAWDRKDPEGEKDILKWDKKNIKKMSDYWNQLVCYREKIKEEGEKAWDAQPQSPENERWLQFSDGFRAHMNWWQQNFFQMERHIQEKSKFVGKFTQAHSLVWIQYTDAYDAKDRNAVKEADARYIILKGKVNRYMKALGHEPKDYDKDDKKWQKFCAKALTPPKNK